jgi:ribosomal 30S subunit maturation factor RimM
VDPSRPPAGYVAVARVGRSHGLAGAMRVRPHDAAGAEALAASSSLWIEGLGEAVPQQLSVHGRGDELLLRVDRVRRVETAKKLVHAEIRVPRPALEAARTALEREAGEDDPRGWVGLPVRHQDRELGRIDAVDGPALQPLLHVQGPHGTLLLPARAPYVRHEGDAVHLVDPPDGLLDPA